MIIKKIILPTEELSIDKFIIFPTKKIHRYKHKYVANNSVKNVIDRIISTYSLYILTDNPLVSLKKKFNCKFTDIKSVGKIKLFIFLKLFINFLIVNKYNYK